MSSPRRVADINPGTYGSIPYFLTAVGNTLYFKATDGSSGDELWKTDGTSTSRVADINPGASNSLPRNTYLTSVGNTLFFTADDGNSGTELWKTDGTATSRIADITPGTLGSVPSNLTAVGNTLFFTAIDWSRGEELWKTDGTTTSRITNINPDQSSFNIRYLRAVGNTIFFTANDGNSGTELWKTDGINTSRVTDIGPGSSGSDIRNPTAVGNTLFFTANDGTSGTELWKTDGITTSRVADIRPGSFDSNPRNLTAVGNTLFFTANDGTSGTELWKTDGTTTSRVTDFNGAVATSGRSLPTAVGNTLFFTASDGSSGYELWALDVGVPIITLALTPASVTEDGVTNLVYTFTRTGATTSALNVNYTVAGTATLGTDYTGIAAAGATKTVTFAAGSTTAVVTVNPTADTDTTDEANETVALTLAAGSGYTVGTTTAVTGTISNDDVVPPSITLALSPASVAEDGLTNLLYTFTRTGPTTSALSVNYTVDGTAILGTDYTGVVAAGTTRTISFAAGSATATVTVDPTPDATIEADETVALTLAVGTGYTIGTTTAVSGTISNDDAASTPRRVSDFNPGISGYIPPSLTAVGNTLFFAADDGSSGSELWKTDGTTTSRVADIYPGVSGSGPRYLTAVGSTLFFTALDASRNFQLWKTDGTTTGTSRVADINPGGRSLPRNLTAVGNTLFFTAFENTSGDELWTTDGTTTGRVTDIRPGSFNSDIRNLTAVGNTLFFSANDGSSGTELWKTNGTTTSRVADINFGASSSIPRNLTAVGDTLFFTANDGSSGTELWKTNGTATSRVTDIRPGSFDSDIRNLTAVGNTLFFTANDGSSGLELWKTDGTSTSRVADINPGAFSSDPIWLTAVGNTLFFAADNGSSGRELWKTDGTTTSRVADINSGASSSNPNSLTVVGNTLFFQATDGSRGYELWTTDGTTTRRVADIRPGLAGSYPAGSYPTYFTAIDNTLFFTATDGTSGTELWALDLDAPSITLVVSPASVTEDGLTNLVYTFTRTGPTTSALTVSYGITGTANATDYTGATPGAGKTITFAAGSATATVTIDPTADTTVESNETVALTLAAGTGYIVGTTTAVTGTIRNDDVALPSITLALTPASVTEDGLTNLVYTFTRTAPTTSALTVNYSITGTAAGSDYTGATPGAGKTITFAAGSATATVTIDPTVDNTVESNETVALTLAAGTGYTVGTTTAVTGTITNDDFPVITLALTPASVTEDGLNNLVYTFTRTGPTTSALTVNYGITGTAAGSDYTGATPGAGKTITFAAGSPTATVTIDPTADTTVETNETVALTLAAGSGYTVGRPTPVTGAIRNDDVVLPSITLALTPASVTEDGLTNLVYTFTRTGPTTSALTVNYGIGGTADTADYIGATPGVGKTITFLAGSATATVTIDPTADTTFEANETVALTLAAGSGYTVGTTTAVTGTITNDDLPIITLALTPASVTEDGLTNLVYTFTRTGPTTSALTVNYGITGTANAADYTGATPGAGKTITFAAGSATALLEINPTSDTTVEVNETVALTLAAGSGYTVGTATPVTGAIRNDDVALRSITLAVAPAWVVEDGTTNSLSINYGINGTADDKNYTGATPGAGQTVTGTITNDGLSATAAITAVDDNVGVIQGAVASAGLTDDLSPTISGTITAALAAGETLRIFNAATLLGSATVDNTAKTWTFTPTLTATASTSYSITARVADAAGNLGVASAARTFTLDTTAPSVVSFSPLDGAAGFDPAASISLGFSEAIQRGSGVLQLRTGSATGPITESFDAATSTRLSISGTGLRIDPTSTLAPNTRYFLTIPAGSLRDAAGNPFAGTSSDDFRTTNVVSGTAAANDILPFTSTVDRLSGLAGADTFRLSSLSDALLPASATTPIDRITDFVTGLDSIDAPVARTLATALNPTAFGAVTELSAAAIGAVLNPASFPAFTSHSIGGAATFTVGTHTFLAINDGVAGFSAASDAILDITGVSGNLGLLQIY